MKHKGSKYRNKKVLIDNVWFDSISEGKRYQELKLLQKAGEIKNLELQPKFILQDSFKYQGKTQRAITYTADFKYIMNGETIIEDVKASEFFKTEVYKIKKKLFLKKYPEYKFIETY